jgi:predicted lipid-binding transport protein (Tim44 family)
MQKRARTVWDGLRSGRQDPGASSGEETAADLSGSGVPSGSVDPGVALPADFDAQDFLDGARLLYSRLQTSWAARNLEDLAPFTTPEMQNMLRRQAELEPAPGSVEVLLVTAVLTGFTRGQGEERVRVAFSALLQQGPEEEGKITVNEIWEFFRGPASGGGWRLSGIEQAPDSLAP